MFHPPRCPNPGCVAHTGGGPPAFHRCGTFAPKCRAHAYQRFRCKHCRRTCSQRTFRADHGDHRPHLNEEVFSRLCSGTGYRQTARELGIALSSLYAKSRKICRHLARLHDNLMAGFAPGSAFLLDELETFEGCRSTRPVTVPILIERESMLIVGARAGQIPPSGRMTAARRAQIAAYRAVHGTRPNESSPCVRALLATLAARTTDLRELEFVTDEKKTYPKLLREAFGEERVRQVRVSSKRVRDQRNPLFRINLTNAIARDRLARLHRRSWCVSKRRQHLESHLSMWIAYRNYHGNRFNRDQGVTPAMLCGFVDRPLSKRELLGWRQDWGPEKSPDPRSRTGESVLEYRTRLAATG